LLLYTPESSSLTTNFKVTWVYGSLREEIMRLSNFYQRSIKDCFIAFFGTGNIYLFGSRVDNSKRGGDIDIYLEIDRPLSLMIN